MDVALTQTLPWAITAEGKDWVKRAVAAGAVDFTPSWKGIGQGGDESTGVAIIPVMGPLTRGGGGLSSFIAMLFGATTYDGIRAQFDSALADDDVRAVLFVVDSPGGEVTGASELSRHIRAARGRKPIEAFVVGQDCSAAYWVTSACDNISASPTAIVGSIGVLRTLIDDSGEQEQTGRKEVNVVSEQAPYKVVDPSKAEDLARVKAMVTSVADVFIGDVAAARGVTPTVVAKTYGKGDVFVGQDAVDAGLVDAVATLDSTFARLAGAKGTGMSLSAKLDKDGDHDCDGCGKSMRSGSKIYCGACRADGQFARDAITLLGSTDTATALTKLREIIASAGNVAELTAKLAEEKTKSRGAEFDALVKQGLAERKITPAQAKADGSVGKLRLLDDAVERLKERLADAVALVDTGTGPREDNTAGAGSVEITAMELKIAKDIVGTDPVKLKAHLDALRAYKAERLNRGGSR